MANEFIIKRGFESKGNSQVTGSLNVSANILANGTIVGSNLSGTNTGDQNLSALALKTAISGAFVAPSASFSTRVTLNDAKLTANTTNVTNAGALMDSEVTDLAGVKGVTISTLQVKPSEGAFANGDKTKLDSIESSADVTDTTNVTSAGALMDSELADIGTIKSLTKAGISGSFIAPSASFSSRTTVLESNPVFTSTMISGSFVAPSSSISTRITFLEEGGAVGFTASGISGSLGTNATLIRSLTAAKISGSFTAASASLSSRITDNTSDITSNRSLITGITSSLDTNGRMVFVGSNGTLTSESGFTYNATTNQLAVENLTVTHLTSSFITSSNIKTSGSNVFGDSTSDTQTFIGTTFISGAAQITGSLGVSANIKSVGTVIGSNLSGTNTGDQDLSTLALKSAVSGSFTAPSQSLSTRVTLNDAKVTANTSNVTSAGALMDSELTDLAGVKGVTISTLQPKPSEGAFANGDKTKLDGIEASADVTDTANVTSAGALMDSELAEIATVKTLSKSSISGSFTELSASLADRAKFTSIWDVVSPSGGQYEFKGPGLTGTENKPALYLTRGEQYQFNINASGHPFYIQTSAGAYNSGNVYNDGVTGNGTQVGDLDFNVQFDAPTTLYYVCSAHSGMGNIIYIDDFIPETALTASYVAGANVDGAVATATLAADATTLATPRAINGVNFDGSAPITITAAGSTLSDTVTVAKGGTGATSLTATRVLIGNGTSAVTTDSGFTYSSNVLSTEGLTITSTSAQNSEATALMINGSNVVGTRELGSNAFNSTTIGTNTNALTVSTGLDLNSGTTFNGSAARTISVDVSDFMTNGSNNRVITATGTDAMNAESNLTFDGSTLTLTGVLNIPGFSNVSASLAAAGSGTALTASYVAGANVDGAVATATLAADATTLATPRAINGVNFDGSAPITITAAGSTLSDTVPVGKGGTGATTLGTNQILIGQGTSAVTTDSGFSYASNILNTEGLNISSVSAQSSEATSLMINGAGVVGTRELGSNAFNSTAIPTAAMISGSFTATSSSFSSRIAATEIITAKTLISGSSQISLSDYSMGTGLDTTGGGTGLALDLSEFTDMTGAIDTAADELILLDSGAERRKLFSEIFGSNAYNSTTIGTTTGALTVSTGLDLNSGTTFNGSAARTISVDVSDFMSNGSNNRIVTATGTDAMNAESNLTFDGSTLALTGVLNIPGFSNVSASLAAAGSGTALTASYVAGANVDGAVATATLAADATTLATPRAINGVNFDGSAPITITAAAGTLSGNTLKSTVLASSLTSVGTLSSLEVTGNLEVGNDIKLGTTDGADQHILDAQDSQIISITDGGLTKLIAAGNLDIGAHTFRASTFYADVATGTAPFTVTSTTPVANLQAATATILHTARNIAGVSFNGSANISLNNNAITNGAGYTTNTGTLTGNGTTNRVPIYNGTTSFTTDSGFTYSSNTLSVEVLNISSVQEQSSEATSLMINGDGIVGYRELGSNAFNSTTIGTNTGALTVDNATVQLNSGTTFNGSAARTLSAKTAAIANGGTALATADQIHTFVTGQTDTMAAATTGNAATATLAANSTLAGGLVIGTGRNNSANQIVRTQANGYAEFGWINTTSGNTTSTITDIYVNTNDGYIRKATNAEFKSQLGIGTNTGALTVSTGLDLNSGTTFNGSAARTISVDVSDFMTNGSNNRIVTATGADAMNAEANLTFDGSTLALTGDFNVGSGDLFVDDSAGNVGIGLTAPVTKLDVGSTVFGLPNTSGTTANGMVRIGYNDRTWSGNEIFLGIINASAQNYAGYIQCKGPTDQSVTRPFLINPQGGNVGIGTDSPSHLLEVQSDTAIASINGATTNGKPMLFIGEQNAYGVGFRWNASLSLDIMDFDNVTPTSTSGTKIGHFEVRNEEFYWKGNVGIGTDAPASKLHVTDAVDRNMNSSGTGQFQVSGNGYQFAVAIGGTTCALYHNSSARTLSLGTNETARLTIAGNSGDTTCTGTLTGTGLFAGSSGKIGGDTTDYITFVNNTRADIYINNSNEFRFESDGDFHADGDVIAQSTTISDSRLKDNILPITGALDKIKSLRGVSYTWNAGKKKDKQDIGLIAQEVEQVIPEIVKDKKMPLMDGTDPDETYKTIDYEKIIAVLVEAVKDQQTQIDDLKKQIKK